MLIINSKEVVIREIIFLYLNIYNRYYLYIYKIENINNQEFKFFARIDDIKCNILNIDFAENKFNLKNLKKIKNDC